MISNTPIFIGLRYTHAKRRHQFISFVSGFSLIGMALGTLALIVVLSVMNGFDREIKERILRVVPHAYLNQTPVMQDWKLIQGQISEVENIKSAAPYISGFVMLSSDFNVQGVELQGVLPTEEVNVSTINDYMLNTSLFALKPNQFSIILGSQVARQLNVSVDDTIIMTLPTVSITPAGLFPRSKRFSVAGIFEVGAQVDQSLALIHLSDAQRLFRYGSSVQGLRIKTDDIYQAAAAVRPLPVKLGMNFEVKDWSQTQGGLFQAIQLEKRMVMLLLMIIIAVAALNIVTSLVLMVSDKRSDIAVLRTLGMTTRQIMAVFVIQGSAVGFIGIVIGSLAGCLLAINITVVADWLQTLVGLYLFDPSIYFISQIPSELALKDVVIVCGVGFILSILATLYPAFRATQVEPAEVLRYE
ncbi:MAG: lipoprotein-releasing system permease protein [Cellvibrionaceae bacterium]|jgi:lipoprotein-releasing system permease protein